MAKPKTKAYGLHLMLDGYGAPAEKLRDVAFLYRTLDDLPGKIGMRKVGFPHIVRFPRGEIEGLSGFIFIVESHISIHTYARKGFLTMDIYSCKTFDPNSVIREIVEQYEIASLEKFLITRGKRFHSLRSP